MSPPRIAAIHDLSCFGRCALTVIMPTLSVMGYQTVPVPTALLSTHTGGFTDLYFHDLTPDMQEIAAHFSRLGITFRSIYTGFLGSERQIETVSLFLNRFADQPDESGEKPLVLIDPVMGDDGVLYSTYTPEMIQGMKEISRRACVLTPNLTEACFLTDTPYRETANLPLQDVLDFSRELLEKLTAITQKRIMITGIRMSDGNLANVGKDLDGSCFLVCKPHEGHSYPGTGDLFASVLLGALLRKESFRNACEDAAAFTSEVIRDSAKADSPVRNGVALESHLYKLVKRPN
ncbi:MAG: pyridoxamine kinase [Clostridia bacterium]|nr:pyridoxamine kinase [Clostridia bacterium]